MPATLMPPARLTLYARPTAGPTMPSTNQSARARTTELGSPIGLTTKHVRFLAAIFSFLAMASPTIYPVDVSNTTILEQALSARKLTSALAIAMSTDSTLVERNDNAPISDQVRGVSARLQGTQGQGIARPGGAAGRRAAVRSQPGRCHHRAGIRRGRERQAQRPAQAGAGDEAMQAYWCHPGCREA